eukprot:GDKI01015409.1.p1 GENE.GDKI01015409.1~~GDKI01015409.1.p1  ORF type:complete len:414 (-),score=175.88 GDKI01015409.1:325-1479(-)
MEVERSAVQQLEHEKNTYPDLGELVDQMLSLFDKKLYHQLTDVVFEYVDKPQVAGKPALGDFFRNFVRPIEKKLNQVRLVALLRRVCDGIGSTAGLALLKSYSEQMKKEKEANIMWAAVTAEYEVKEKQLTEAVETLELAEKLIAGEMGVDVSVNAAFHRASAALHQARGEHEDYYKHSLLFLAYTPSDAIPPADRPKLAHEIALAAMVAPNVYNFGELLQQPLIRSLESDASFTWVRALLTALHEGSIDMYDQAALTHRASIDGSALRGQDTVLKQKVTLLALLELAFRKPKKQRTLEFNEIATHCRLPVDQVEYAVMKAMSVQLLKGQIDQVDQIVRVTWIRPRILDKERLELMKERVEQWAGAAKTLLLSLEELTPELLVS